MSINVHTFRYSQLTILKLLGVIFGKIRQKLWTNQRKSSFFAVVFFFFIKFATASPIVTYKVYPLWIVLCISYFTGEANTYVSTTSGWPKTITTKPKLGALIKLIIARSEDDRFHTSRRLNGIGSLKENSCAANCY